MLSKPGWIIVVGNYNYSGGYGKAHYSTTVQKFNNSPIPESIDGYKLKDIGYEHDAATSWGCIFLALCRLVVRAHPL